MSNLSSYSCGGNDSLNASNSGEMIRQQELIKELKHIIKWQQELIEVLQIQLQVSEERNTVLQQDNEAKLVSDKTCKRDKLQRECEELRDGTTSLQVTKSQLKAQLRQLKREVYVQKEKLSRVESQKVDLATELDVKKAELEGVTRELDVKKAELEGVTRELDVKKAELEGVTRKLLEQKLKLEELENQYPSQENDKHKMEVNILELEEKLIDLTVKFKQLQDEKKVLEAQLSSTMVDQYSVMKSLNLESVNILNTIQEQVDVLQCSTDHVSSTAEIYGAVQQESHESRVMLDVENLNEKLHVELQETRVVGGSMEDIKELSERLHCTLALIDRMTKNKNSNSCIGPEHLSNSTVQLGEDGDHERVPSLSESDTDCADTLHILEDSGSGLIHQTFMAVMDRIPPLNVDYVLYQMCRCVRFLYMVGALWLFFKMFMFVLGSSRNCESDGMFELPCYGLPPT